MSEILRCGGYFRLKKIEKFNKTIGSDIFV